MATTILEEFDGDAELTPEKIETIKEWYASYQGDADKTGEVEMAYYYQGGVDACLSVLRLLFNKPVDPEEPCS